MENIIITPENKKQFTAIKNFLEEMKIHFRTEKEDDTLMTEEEFYEKIDRSIKQVEQGKVHRLTPELQKKNFLGIFYDLSDYFYFGFRTL